jgi:transposase
MKKYTSVIVSAQPVLGLDVASASFVAALRVDATRVIVATFANRKAGFRSLRTWLHQHFAGGVRAGLEATGVYGQPLAHWLHARGHTVHVLNPARVAAYARSTGQRNKTDPADARTIAAYVATHELAAWMPPPPAHLALQNYCRLRQQLATQRQQLKNQLHSAPELARAYLQRLIAGFDAELARLAQAIAAHLAAHPVLAAAVRRLTTIPGVGELTATVCVAELPPIAQDSDPRALSAWCALTPRRQQSGQSEHRAHLGRTGNLHLRQALHMPALVAKRYNPLLRTFALRLAKNGKRHGAILGAVAHKLLRLMIGLLRHQHDFDPNWLPQKS